MRDAYEPGGAHRGVKISTSLGIADRVGPSHAKFRKFKQKAHEPDQGEGDQNSGIFKRGPCGRRAHISAKFRNFFSDRGEGVGLNEEDRSDVHRCVDIDLVPD